jgi:Uma2 family endonuclease
MQKTPCSLTFEEYLTYSDGTDNRYELVNGTLVLLKLGTGLQGEITDFLERTFKQEIEQENQPWSARKLIIGVRSPRGGRWDTSRIPDIVVIPNQQWQTLRNREAVIELNEPAPLLVVEVVSESTKTVDYRSKRSEYSVLEIPEYWIVDPLENKVTLCILNEGFYDCAEFQGDAQILSPTFPKLKLTAAQILNAGS